MAFVENPYAASRILLWMHHAFSSKIHFCNTSNVLGSFLEGRPPAGGAVGHPFSIKILIISLVSCVFAAQGWVCVGFFQNVLFCRILTFTRVRSMIVILPRVIFGWLARVVLLRILILTKVRRMIVQNHHLS